MEIIIKRRELLGQNIKYLEKESEIKFESRRIKYLRRALMIIKMNTQIKSDFLKEVEEEYMAALEENFDYKQEPDYF